MGDLNYRTMASRQEVNGIVERIQGAADGLDSSMASRVRAVDGGQSEEVHKDLLSLSLYFSRSLSLSLSLFLFLCLSVCLTKLTLQSTTSTTT